EVALDLVTAKLLQQMHLRVVLDALGDDFQAERVGERNDHGDDIARITGIAHAYDEAAVDLEDIDRQPRQVAERAITRAEIVHRDFDAGAAQRLQLARARLDVVDENALRDLEVDQRLAVAHLVHRFEQPVDEVALAELGR